jgi:hypothetical protein
MRLSKWQSENHKSWFGLRKLKVLILDFQDFIRPQQAQEGNGVGSMQESPYTPSSPLW